MERYAIDENEYLAIMVDKYADMILRLALAQLGNLADAQDVCQEVYIKLFKHKHTFSDAEHEKAWIIRVTINIWQRCDQKSVEEMVLSCSEHFIPDRA